MWAVKKKDEAWKQMRDWGGGSGLRCTGRSAQTGALAALTTGRRGRRQAGLATSVPRCEGRRDLVVGSVQLGDRLDAEGGTERQS